MDGDIQTRLQAMSQLEGPEPLAALRRLAVCRGGWSYSTAGAILDLKENEDRLAQLLATLQKYQLITWRVLPNGQTRYDIDPETVAAVGEDSTARAAHFATFEELVRQHDDVLLADEHDNLNAAFEWVVAEKNASGAYWFYNACCDFLSRQGWVEQRMEWLERVSKLIEANPDAYLQAAVQTSAGNAYWSYPHGDRAANLHKAVDAYQAALTYYTPQNAPLAYVTTQRNLGAVYRALAQVEERSDNLHRASAAYQTAHDHCPDDCPPSEKAIVLHGLGMSLWELSRSENRTDNLHRAEAAFRSALSLWTPQTAPAEYATALHNLGTTHYDMSESEDRAVNLGKAIMSYREALDYRRPENVPLEYAMTQNNLGAAYQRLADIQDAIGNLRRAVSAYKEALHYYTPETAPLAYAMTQNNLAAIYRNLAHFEDRAENLRHAVSLYKQTMTYYTPQSSPLDYAMLQHNLGVAYAELAMEENHQANLESAVAAYREALNYRQPDSAPLSYAMTLRNLGIALENLGDMNEAHNCWYDAERVYRQLGVNEQADQLLRWIERTGGKRGQR